MIASRYHIQHFRASRRSSFSRCTEVLRDTSEMKSRFRNLVQPFEPVDQKSRIYLYVQNFAVLAYGKFVIPSMKPAVADSRGNAIHSSLKGRRDRVKKGPESIFSRLRYHS